MNRIMYLLILATIFTINQGNAQLLRSVGAKVAVTSAWQKVDWGSYPPDGYPRTPKHRSGVNAAIYAEWLNVPFLSLVTQVEYAQRGFTADYDVRNVDPPPVRVTQNNRVEYLSVPILLKVSPIRGVLEPYIVIGPRFDWYLGYNDNMLSAWVISQHFKSRTYGGTVGIGCEVRRLLPIVVSLEMRYNGDFVDSFNDALSTVRNNSIDLWLGVAL